MKHEVIFVVGPPRTGTSVLMMCLQNSGYKIGNLMLGHKYQSQDRFFMTVNREITRLLYKQLLENKKDYGKPIVIGEPISREINKFWKYVLLYKIEALKDPLFYEIFGVYWNVSPIFREQKFIWTHREPLEAAKSAVRLKRMKGVPELETITRYNVQTRLKKIEAYNNIHETYFEKCNGINVYFEELINDTEKVGGELSEFLGRNINMYEVNKKETYKESRVPQ